MQRDTLADRAAGIETGSAKVGVGVHCAVTDNQRTIVSRRIHISILIAERTTMRPRVLAASSSRSVSSATPDRSGIVGLIAG